MNESKNIGSVVLKAKKHVGCVLVVNDGSTDDTAEVAEAAGAIVISHSRNRGKGMAIKSAFTWARNNECTALVMLDGDGQHDAADIPKLLQPVLEGRSDMVVGSRFLSANRIPFYRRVGLQVLTFVTNLGSRVKLTDTQSGFRAFSARALEAMVFSENSYSIESEMQIIASRLGLNMSEVPISVRYFGGGKKNPLEHGTNVLTRVLTMFVLRKPLLLFGVPALVLLGSGIGTAVHTVTTYNSTGQLAVGYSLLTLLLLLAGLSLAFFSTSLWAMKEMLRD